MLYIKEMLLTDKLHKILFYLLFFLTPLVLFTKTSELFEFNKIILVYLLTILILATWVIKSVLAKKIIFKKTVITLPIILFLLTQIISTFVSIDVRTSMLGYYSRFHGGLMSTLSYVGLYFAYVSNMDKKSAIYCIYFAFLSACLVSVYGILQHFGIDKQIWVQDVQNRVFSTLGQPNWLAAWLVALIPLSWAKVLELKNGKAGVIKLIFFHTLAIVLFITLLFTKSRSGILGFAVTFVIFWCLTLYTKLKSGINIKQRISVFIVSTGYLLMATFVIGTPWTSNIKQLLNLNSRSQIADSQNQALKIPVLELGGTPSTEIRKIVWKGAITIWKNYPIFGTGVETFAFAYYQFRPAAHNLTSEWDHLYNKAHNEYLNYAATSGTLGLSAYLLLIIFSLIQIYNSFRNSDSFLLPAIIAGYSSILVTNFFGFSVVPVALEFFLFPAFALSLSIKSSHKKDSDRLVSITFHQKLLLLFVLLTTVYLLRTTFRYYLADLNYAKGRERLDTGNLYDAKTYLRKAISYSPNEAFYWIEHSEISAKIAQLVQKENPEMAREYALMSVMESQKAISLSPANVNLKRSQASNFVTLSVIDADYLKKGIEVLELAIAQAPTDAKLFYNLGYAYLQTGEFEKAEKIFEYTVDIKPDYRLAHLALAYLYIDKGESEKAKKELEYILKHIDPNDEVSKRELRELKTETN